jgi:hypothetical protein
LLLIELSGDREVGMVDPRDDPHALEHGAALIRLEAEAQEVGRRALARR